MKRSGDAGWGRAEEEENTSTHTHTHNTAVEEGRESGNGFVTRPHAEHAAPLMGATPVLLILGHDFCPLDQGDPIKF